MTIVYDTYIYIILLYAVLYLKCIIIKFQNKVIASNGIGLMHVSWVNLSNIVIFENNAPYNKIDNSMVSLLYLWSLIIYMW